MSVAECTRNVAMTGARPLGITDCLNYGDPERPEAFWQLSEAVRGLAEACRALGLPVTGGNVSLYNESAQRRDPADTRDRRRRAARRHRPAGRARLPATTPRSSLWRRRSRRACRQRPTRRLRAPRPTTARPRSTWRARRRSQAFPAGGDGAGAPAAAQDVSGGGLAVALAEMCHVGRASAPRPAAARGADAGRRAVRRGPSRVVVMTSSGLPIGTRLACMARGARRAARAAGPHGRRAAAHRLVGEGATGAAEERGAGVADRSKSNWPACATPGRRPARAVRERA